jgi:predicted phage terminase large subunit-like protein
MNRTEINALLRADPYSFIKYFFKETLPGEFEDALHLEAIAYQIKCILEGDQKRLIVNLPPRHLKSFCFSVVLVALYLGHYPDKKVLCVSYSDELAAVLSRQCKKLMSHPRYKEIFPQTIIGREKNAEMEFETTLGGGRRAISMSGAATGYGADLLIIDDPVKPENMKSLIERQRVKDIIDGTLYSRLNSKDEGIIVLVMQRLHGDDPTVYLLEKGSYTHMSFPAIAREEESIQVSAHQKKLRKAGTVLLPGRESLETLERVKCDIGNRFFEAQYQQNPLIDAGAFFKREWLSASVSSAWPAHEHYEHILASWDVANKPGEGHDYTAGTVWGVHKGLYYLLEVIRIRVAYPELKKRVVSVHKSYPRCRTLIEDAANGVALLQDLKSVDMRVVACSAQPGKEVRAEQASGVFEAGKVILPATAPWREDYINELLHFPDGKYDDMVDSTTQALFWHGGKKKKRVLIFSPPEVFCGPRREDFSLQF